MAPTTRSQTLKQARQAPLPAHRADTINRQSVSRTSHRFSSTLVDKTATEISQTTDKRSELDQAYTSAEGAKSGHATDDVSAAPVEKLFDTPELVHEILLLLSGRDLLDVAATNQFFRNVVGGSKKLQKKLYLVPEQAPVGTNGEMSFADYLGGLLGMLTPSDGTPKLNSMIFGQVKDGLPAAHTAEPGKAIVEAKVMVQPSQHPVASYRRMLLTQPPVDIVTVHDRTSHGRGNAVVLNATGVTFRDVLDQMTLSEQQFGPPLEPVIVRFPQLVVLTKEEEKQSNDVEENTTKMAALQTESDGCAAEDTYVDTTGDGDQEKEDEAATADKSGDDL